MAGFHIGQYKFTSQSFSMSVAMMSDKQKHFAEISPTAKNRSDTVQYENM
jgi:hypothetical protein